LKSGEATGADKGCTRRHSARVEDGRVYLALGFTEKQGDFQ